MTSNNIGKILAYTYAMKFCLKNYPKSKL